MQRLIEIDVHTGQILSVEEQEVVYAKKPIIGSLRSQYLQVVTVGQDGHRSDPQLLKLGVISLEVIEPEDHFVHLFGCRDVN